MRIFLLHGMARTPVSMGLLAWRLKKAGHAPHLFGYTVLTHDLERIAERFAERVHRVLDGASSYAVIGHSLGNLITRLASPRLPPGFERFVMLAPPNRPPAIACTPGPDLVLRFTAGDAGRKLRDPGFFAGLPMPEVPALIIAGNRGPRAGWLPFEGAPNDAILRVDETLLAGVATVELPAVHTFLMNHREVARVILRFLAAERLC